MHAIEAGPRHVDVELPETVRHAIRERAAIGPD